MKQLSITTTGLFGILLLLLCSALNCHLRRADSGTMAPTAATAPSWARIRIAADSMDAQLYGLLVRCDALEGIATGNHDKLPTHREKLAPLLRSIDATSPLDGQPPQPVWLPPEYR